MPRTPNEPARSISTRISGDLPNTLTNRVLAAFSRRRYGAVLDPLVAVGHHGKVTRTYALTELGVGGWKALDPGLKSLAVMAASVSIGCTWCVDFGYWEAEHEHIDPATLHDVPAWRSSERFTDLERDVLALAEAETATPPSADDELVARLIAALGEEAFTELVAIVAVENLRSRINATMGLSAQGFSDRCEVPLGGALGEVAGP
ncbi:carboxymuconolactone decarboxylase family protein [Promicromonospora iranensis]|uniref:AhpD family alkylhydroperoxidase n=1 Tax=Promicromonospora iranensis TaxID=1105144 RepID=A0ABU2CT77_9MICO|nr:carboxymuconolactone decarboxylase family protein [Promicromonospora iranensis]MDR7384548.1 AhpD family alkylhydroperoxidase [Promicromonospora iranensis]